MSSQLLLSVAGNLLDEILQLLHQLSVAQCQLVRGDAEDLPEGGKGPGGNMDSISAPSLTSSRGLFTPSTPQNPHAQMAGP